jgi:hypothetical protein
MAANPRSTMWAQGLKQPKQVADGRAVCFCGAAIGIANMSEHVYSVYMESEAA